MVVVAKIVPDEGRVVFDETWQTLRTESALPRGAMEIKQATRIPRKLRYLLLEVIVL